MSYKYGVVLAACALLGQAAVAQDSLIGKKKGSGSSAPTSSTPSKPAAGQSKQPTASQRSPVQKGETRTVQGTVQRTSQGSSDLLRRGPQQSRSGQVNYGTTNNLWSRVDANRAPVIRRAPSQADIRRRHSMGDQIRREDRVRVEYDNHNGWRVGYYQYDRRWRDDQFHYPYYVFNPYAVQTCVASPWYYYPYLPPYINSYRTVFAGDMTSFFGLPYEWQPSRYRSRDYGDYDRDWYSGQLDRRDLDFAIDDIVEAFLRQDRRAVDRLVPRNGNVTLNVDSTITYGVNVDDFYDMLMDAVLTSDTRDYEIVSVRTNDNEAEVLGLHLYLDPWGQRQSVYHRIRLREERGRAVIRYFATTQNPNW